MLFRSAAFVDHTDHAERRADPLYNEPVRALPGGNHVADGIGQPGDGADAVFDVIGGGRQLWRSSRALRKGGRLVMLGMASAVKGGMKKIPGSMMVVGAVKILPNGKTAPMGPGMESYPKDHMDWYRDSLAEFFELAVTGKMKPVIAARFPLSEAARAHEFIERGGYAGKVVLTVE